MRKGKASPAVNSLRTWQSSLAYSGCWKSLWSVMILMNSHFGLLPTKSLRSPQLPQCQLLLPSIVSTRCRRLNFQKRSRLSSSLVSPKVFWRTLFSLGPLFRMRSCSLSYSFSLPLLYNSERSLLGYPPVAGCRRKRPNDRISGGPRSPWTWEEKCRTRSLGFSMISSCLWCLSLGVASSQLSAEEFERFRDLNERYEKKFGFPFILSKSHSSLCRCLTQKWLQTCPRIISFKSSNREYSHSVPSMKLVQSVLFVKKIMSQALPKTRLRNYLAHASRKWWAWNHGHSSNLFMGRCLQNRSEVLFMDWINWYQHECLLLREEDQYCFE